MKKILFVTGTLSNGGAERVISILANELSKFGNKVAITCIYNDKNDYLKNKDIKLISIKHKYKNRFIRAFEIVYNLIKIFIKEKPDIIISFVWQVNIYSILANIVTRKRLIVSERNDPHRDPKNKYLARIRNVSYKFCSGVVFQTEKAKSYFSNRIQKKSTIISNPIKEGLPDWDEENHSKKIITACRLMKQKNLPLLFKSFKNICDKYPEYSLDIFGDGELKEDLNRMVIDMGMSERIILKGFNNNIHKEMASSSVFVISSDYEGISNSMLEALVIGIPVISTDSPSGGAKMFIKDGINGILTKVGDLNELSTALDKVLSNKEYAIALSKEAKKLRSELSPEIITNEWMRYIDKICGGENED